MAVLSQLNAQFEAAASDSDKRRPEPGGRVESTSQAECAGSIPVIGSTPSWSDPPRSPLSWAGGPVHRASAHASGSPGEPSSGSSNSIVFVNWAPDLGVQI
jgi:hypothetical protein